MAELPQYTVSMSVYSGEKAEFLRASLESMFSQTHPCRRLILVCDGELGKALEGVVAELETRSPQQLCVRKMDKNRGEGACANAAANVSCG